MSIAPLKPVRVTVRTSVDSHQDWKVEVTVLPSTTVLQIREILVRRPHYLRLEPEHRALRRCKQTTLLEGLDDNEPVPSEIILKDFVPRPTYDPSEADVVLSRPHRDALWAGMEQAKVEHRDLPPGERRWRSWARTVAHTIGQLQFYGTRRGTEKRPFVVWVLGCTLEVEVHLAQMGYFSDVSLFGNQPCDVWLVGEGLGNFQTGPEDPLEGHPPRVRAVPWEVVHTRQGPRPDLNVVFHEPDQVTGWASSASRPALAAFNSVVAGATLFTMRYKLPEETTQALSQQLGDKLLVNSTRNPFSAGAGDPSQEYDDNGWWLLFKDFHNVAVLASELKQYWQNQDPRAVPPQNDDVDKRSATFWGIIDLKYDPGKPIDERVKVLETGDGRSSRFSHAGAPIPKRFRQKYKLDEGANSGKHAVVSANKKLTHDLMEFYGYGHLVPRQVCCPRAYDPGLAAHIIQELGVSNEELVVLKLCNRSRAAGVLPVPAGGLDGVLREVLQLPPDFEAWMREKLAAGTASTLKVDWGCYEEQLRHWWSNECPHFVAEQFASSVLTVKDDKEWDGTMRIAFALAKKKLDGNNYWSGSPKSDYSNPLLEYSPAAEELEVEWIGGYWKLPKEDVESNNIRASVISAARTAGTEFVSPAHLAEVYAAMGHSVQQLFGGSEPSPRMLTDWYSEQPELATYLTARLAIAMRDLSRVRMALKLANSALANAPEGPAKSSAESFLNRGYGVVEALTPPFKWAAARDFFKKSVDLLPANAASLYLLGMAELELGNVVEAAAIMERSLVLDLDFKAPYVNLGVTYIRLSRFDEAIEISEALLKRHPESPQCHYHIGVACYQKAHHLENMTNQRNPANAQVVADLKARASSELTESRDSEEGQRLANRGIRGGPGRSDSPWLDSDEAMVSALAKARSSSGFGRIPAVELSENIGWRFYGWRN